jgi:nicotinate phosphoribosyltransferase
VTTLDDVPAGEPLLQPVMREGRRLAPSPELTQVRGRVSAHLARLPDDLRRLDSAGTYEVGISSSLQQLAESVDHSA